MPTPPKDERLASVGSRADERRSWEGTSENPKTTARLRVGRRDAAHGLRNLTREHLAPASSTDAANETEATSASTPPSTAAGTAAGAEASGANAVTPAALVGDAEFQLQVGGVAGVPADAAAVTLNVTVTNPSAAGFVTVWPCGQPRPLASNLNYVAGQSVPNLVLAKLGAAGECVSIRRCD